MEFKKSGFGDEDAAQLAKLAAEYKNISDTEVSAADASAYIISQQKAYNISVEDSESILDKTGKVANAFAVSFADVSGALTKTSAAMSTYGNTQDQTMGLVVAGTEIMTGQASKVSKGLRTIGANISKFASQGKDISFTVDGVSKSLSVMDEQTGKMKNTYEILNEIHDSWANMTAQEKSTLALQLAGRQASCSYRFNCWKYLKFLSLNYCSNTLVA